MKMKRDRQTSYIELDGGGGGNTDTSDFQSILEEGMKKRGYTVENGSFTKSFDAIMEEGMRKRGYGVENGVFTAPKPFVGYNDALGAAAGDADAKKARMDNLLGQYQSLERELQGSGIRAVALGAENDAIFESGRAAANPYLFERYRSNFAERKLTNRQQARLRQSMSNVYGEYEKAVEDYNASADRVNQLYGQSGEAWDEYTRTVRSADKIEADIEKTQEEIRSLQQEERALMQKWGLGTEAHTGPRDAAGQALYSASMEQAGVQASESPQISRIEERKSQAQKNIDRLREELEMSGYLQSEATRKGYEELRQAADFEEKSGYSTTANGRKKKINSFASGSGGTVYDETGFDDLTYEVINGNEEARGIMMAQKSGMYDILLGEGDVLSYMTEEEKRLYNYIHAVQGTEAADGYLEYLKTTLTERQRKGVEGEDGQREGGEEAHWREYAEEHPVGASVFSVLTSPLKGISYLGQTADYLADGKIDQNAAYNRFSYSNSAVRDEVSKTIEESGKWGKAGSFLYQTGMSMGDFLLDAAVSGGYEALSLAIMGTGAAADAVIEAKDRGLSDKQSFILGSVAGAAEIVTEKVSLEALFDKTAWSKSAIGYFLKNVLAEGSEEGASDIINWVADVLVAGDKSEWKEAIRAYEDQGLSEDKAFIEAVKDKAGEIGLDMLGGALSGGVMAGGSLGFSAAQNFATGRELTVKTGSAGSAAQAAIDTALEGGKGTRRYEQAVKYRSDLLSGKKPTSAKTGRLVNNTLAEVYAEQEAKAKEEKKNAPGSGAENWLVPISETMRQSLSTGKNNIIARTAEDIVSFVKSALQKKGGSERLYMGTIPDSASELVRKSTGVDVSGFNAILPGSSVQHIFNHHGDERTEAPRGQRAVTAEDISLIPQVIASPDSVTLSEDTDADGRRVLLFTKEIGDTIVTAQAVTDGRHALTTSTLWVQKKKGPLVTTPNARTSMPSLGFDVRNAPPSGPSGANVSQSASDVNDEIPPAPMTIEERDAAVREREAALNLRAEELNTRGNVTDGERAELAREYEAIEQEKREIAKAETARWNEQRRAETTLPTAQQAEERRERANTQINSTAGGAAYQKGANLNGGENITGTGAQRQAGTYSGEPARSVAGGPIQIPEGTDTGRAAVLRSRYAQNSGLQKVSSKSLGLSTGTDKANLTVIPEESYDGALKRVSEKVYRDTGMRATFVAGGIEVNGRRGTQRVRGVYGDGVMVIQADHLKYSPEQIADHETYHDAVSNTPGLRSEMRERITERFTEEELQRDIEKYIEAVGGAYDLDADNMDPEQMERLLSMAEEELMADAYAGINSFGAKASRYTDTAREVMRGQGFGTQSGNAQTQTTRGPPSGTRYSAEDGSFYEDVDLSHDGAAYTYDFLTSLPDMTVTALPDLSTLRDDGGRIDKGLVVAKGMGNARSIGTERAGKVLVQNGYTGRELRIDYSSIRHGLYGDVKRVFVNAKLGSMIGDVIKNAVPVNALHNTAKDVSGTYAMATLATESDGHKVVAVITVEEGKGDVIGLEAYDAVHAVSGRQQKRSERVGLKSPQGVIPSTNASTISIEDFLEIVNRTYQSILSDDVLEHLGEKRDPSGYYSGRVKYSIEDEAEARDYEERVRAEEEAGKAEEELAPDAWTGVSLDRAGEVFSNLDSVLSNQTYGEGKAYSKETIRKLLKVRNDPNGKVRVFLPVGSLATSTDIKTGQTVYPSVEKAREVGRQLYGDDFVVAGKDVKAKFLFVNENSINEWGYDRRGGIRRGELEAERRGERQVKPKTPASKPSMAKANLRQALLNTFSVPEGSRSELGAVVDRYADRMLRDGQITEVERQTLFRALFEAGDMVVETNDTQAKALREMVRQGRIYVNEQVKTELGDNWNALRSRAFASGFFLVTDRSMDARGIDQWNAELAEAFPGIFDADDTDLASVLYSIVEAAEEARGEHMTLDQYARELTGEYGRLAEDDFYDNLERQFDYALRAYAESARIELKLRDRTGKIIAQEREAAAEAREAERTRTKAREDRLKDEKKAAIWNARQMEKARAEARRAKEREWAQMARAEASEERFMRELKEKTRKSLEWLSRNRDKAPAELKPKIAEVLSDIDIYAVSAAKATRYSKKYDATWGDLGEMYKQAKANDPNFLPSAELERIVARLDNRKLDDMDYEALDTLFKAATNLRTEFENRNKVLGDEAQRQMKEVYEDSKRELEEVSKVKGLGYSKGKIKNFLNDAQLSARNYIERMFGWNPDSEGDRAIGKQLEDGERNVRAYTVRAEKKLAAFLTENEEWAVRADGQGKNGIWYEMEVNPLSELLMNNKPVKEDRTVKIYFTPAQKVHMYLESQNYDNLRHMTGGRTFANKELYSQGMRDEATSVEQLKKAAVPMLFIHGEEDTFVPYEMLDVVFDACASAEKQKLSVPNASHGAAADTAPRLYWEMVADFIGKYVG